MMIPITRKEKYINEIVGGGNTAPETPQTREEIFYAAILGEVVAPSPITRSEKYLAKIANKYSGELPEPVTRIERFLARAAGMDVTIPTPVTREEMFWADYVLIVEKEISGIPPLTFNAIAGTLKNYRIYGNTVDGESVGNFVTDGDHAGEYCVPVIVEGKNLLQNTATTQTINGVTFTVNNDGSVTCNGTSGAMIQYNINTASLLNITENVILSGCPSSGSSSTFLLRGLYPFDYTTSNDDGNGVLINRIGEQMRVQIRIASGYTCNNLTFYPMIRRVEIADGTYEPYQTPITTNIYLTEQIRKVGNEAEYIDFKAQKQYFADGTSVDVGLLALPTIAGTNVLTVGTEVQPSDAYIKYEGAR